MDTKRSSFLFNRIGRAWQSVPLLAAFVLIGCTGVHFVQPAAPTITLQANPVSVTAGSTSTLMVTAGNAAHVSVTGSDGSGYSLPAAGGTQTVTPMATTTYIATATGRGGTAIATAQVAVVPVVLTPTVTIKASVGSIVLGTSCTLTIAAANDSTLTLTGSDGSSYTLPSGGGAQVVSPAATTTYTATATGSGGTVSATAVVTVTPAPAVTISANPASIAPGGSSTLKVIAANAASVVISGSDGASYNLPATGGTQLVTPSATTTYRATASSGTVSATAMATVIVSTMPTVTISANPSSIVLGGVSTLTVAAANATSVALTGSDGTSYNMTDTGGTAVVSPARPTTYTAIASNGSASATAKAAVTITASNAVAFVYVSSTSNNDDSALITAFAADANGQFEEVGSKPLAANEIMTAAEGNSLFTVDPYNVHTYAIEADGAVGNQTSEIDTQTYGGHECGTATGNSFLDRTGDYLTVELYSQQNTPNGYLYVCDGWQTYKISSNGNLEFMSDYGATDPQHRLPDGAQQLGISATSSNNGFAYGIVNNQLNTSFTAFKRTSTGELLFDSGFSEIGPLPDPTADLAPALLAADSSDHLAVLLYAGDSPNSASARSLASYTIVDATGGIDSSNPVADMPVLAISPPDTIAVSPSNQLLAVGAGDSESSGTFGLQLFYFNGADPVTPFTPNAGTLLPGLNVSQVAWDNANHLYVLGQSSGDFNLYVFTVTTDSVAEVAKLLLPPNSTKLIVVPQP